MLSKLKLQFNVLQAERPEILLRLHLANANTDKHNKYIYMCVWMCAYMHKHWKLNFHAHTFSRQNAKLTNCNFHTANIDVANVANIAVVVVAVSLDSTLALQK